jgi:prevent-host-death family protein
MKVSITDAKKRLAQLIKAAERGETVTICRRGVPVVDLVRASSSPRRIPNLGTMRDRIKINDPDWWKPMTEEELDAFLEGRY